MDDPKRRAIPRRMRKFELGDRVRVNDAGPEDYRDRIGTVTEIGPGKTQYRVEFEDDHRPTTGYLSSSDLYST
jgi:hypothetical protein